MQRSWSLGFGFCLCIHICICICIRICIVCCPLCVCVSVSVCLLLSHTLFGCFFVFRFSKFNAYLIWLFALWPSLRLLTLKLMSGGGSGVPAPEEANRSPCPILPPDQSVLIFTAPKYTLIFAVALVVVVVKKLLQGQARCMYVDIYTDRPRELA